MSVRDDLKNILRTELPFTFGRGAVEAINGLHDINYTYNSENESRILNLENNESIFQVFAYVAKSSSGQIPIYEGCSIFDVFQDGVIDAIAVKADENNQPIEEFVFDDQGQQVNVTSLSETGVYLLSNIPTDNTCIIYYLKCKDIYKQNVPNDYIIPPVITNRDIYNHQNSTGALYFEGLSINLDITKFNVGRVICEFVDNTDPLNPTIQLKDFSSISGVTVDNMVSQNVTYVAIDRYGDIIQSSAPFTSEQRRVYVQLGVIVHSNRININAVNNQPEIITNVLNQLGDLIDGIGSFNISGNIISNYSTDLRIIKTEGFIFKRGANYVSENLNPHKIFLSELNPVTFRYRLQDGTEYPNTQNIDPGFYDLNGVLTDVGNDNRYTIQRIYIFQSNLARIQYGQAYYSTMDQAISYITRENFITEQNISENGLLLGYLVLKRNAANLSDIAQATFIRAGKFGSGTSGGSSYATSLQRAYENGQSILTDAIRDGVIIQRGSSLDTDKLLKFKNGNGDEVEYVTGEGFKAIRYRDEYVGGGWVAAGGAASPDEVSYTIGGVGTRKYSFDGGVTEERLSNSFEMAHDIAYDEINDETLFIEAHIHWRPTGNTSGNVVWFFDYSYDPVNTELVSGGAPIPQTTLTATGIVNLNEQYFHKITSFVDGTATIRLPKPINGFSIGDLINFTIRRTPASAGDTYGSDAILEKVALHVPTNDFGSRQRYIK